MDWKKTCVKSAWQNIIIQGHDKLLQATKTTENLRVVLSLLLQKTYRHLSVREINQLHKFTYE